MVMSGTRKTKVIPKTHKIYCTYFPDGRYYIGYSCKTDKLYEKYLEVQNSTRICGELKRLPSNLNKSHMRRCKNFCYMETEKTKIVLMTC